MWTLLHYAENNDWNLTVSLSGDETEPSDILYIHTDTHTRKTYNSTRALWKRDACFGSKQSSSASALPSLRKKNKTKRRKRDTDRWTKHQLKIPNSSLSCTPLLNTPQTPPEIHFSKPLGAGVQVFAGAYLGWAFPWGSGRNSEPPWWAASCTFSCTGSSWCSCAGGGGEDSDGAISRLVCRGKRTLKVGWESVCVCVCV